MTQREAATKILTLVNQLDDALKGCDPTEAVSVIDPFARNPQFHKCAEGCQDLRAFLNQQLEYPRGVM